MYMTTYRNPLLDNQRVAGSLNDKYLTVKETIGSRGFRKGAAIAAAAVALGLAALAADIPKKAAEYTTSIPMSSVEEAVKYGPYSGSQYQNGQH